MRIASLLFAAAVLQAAAVRAAAPASFAGGPGDLDKAVDARSARLGKIVPASATLSQLVAALPKGALVRFAFADIGAVSNAGGKTSFVGHHSAAGLSDFALVTFPSPVVLTVNSAAVVVGSFAGTRQVTAANGSKVTLPVVDARVLGVIDGAGPAGAPSAFGPGSPIRVYERPARKAAAK